MTMPEFTGNASAVEADLAGFIRTALTEVCLGDGDRYPLEATVARYFHPDFRQEADGRIVEYAEFVDQMRLLRGRVFRGRVEVVRALREGHLMATRHRVYHLRANGSETHGEVFLFGEFAADYRILRVTEMSRLITASEFDSTGC
jgi:hypothetical protein